MGVKNLFPTLTCLMPKLFTGEMVHFINISVLGSRGSAVLPSVSIGVPGGKKNRREGLADVLMWSSLLPTQSYPGKMEGLPL